MKLEGTLRIVLLLSAFGGVEAGAKPNPSRSEAKMKTSVVATWIYQSPQGPVTMVLGADGAGTLNGAPFQYTFGGGKLVGTANGVSLSYDAELEGDALTVSGGNLPMPVTYTRQTGEKSPIVGNWKFSSPNGTLTLSLRADGSGALNGAAFRYTFASSKLIASAKNQSMTYDVSLKGDALTLSGGDLPAPVTFARQAAAAVVTGPMADVAGLWVVQESSLDPQFYLSYTQYVTLYPNGTVSYQKAEGSASRTQISDTLERFRSSREASDVIGDAGTWETDGTSITVRWSRWNSLVSQGRVSGNQLTLSRMGVLESGATLTFKREQ